MLDWFNFRLGVISGLIMHALEKRYSQNKTQLRYNFGSVYILDNYIMSQLGLDVGGNFNIHIWACSGDVIVRNRWTGNVTV